MKRTWTGLWTAALASTLVLSACGSPAPSGSSAAPQPASSAATAAPTSASTSAPTTAPTAAPTLAPTIPPTVAPTAAPTTAPTAAPAATTAPATKAGASTAPCGSSAQIASLQSQIATLSGDAKQLGDEFLKIQQARCNVKTYRVKGTITSAASPQPTTMLYEGVVPDRAHSVITAPPSGQAAQGTQVEFIAIGNDLYIKQGAGPWQAVPAQAGAGIQQSFAKTYGAALTFDFSALQGAQGNGGAATPNPTAQAVMRSIKVTKSASSRNGVACDEYKMTVGLQQGEGAETICIDTAKNLPIELNFTAPSSEGGAPTGLTFSYEWDVPITIAKPI